MNISSILLKENATVESRARINEIILNLLLVLGLLFPTSHAFEISATSSLLMGIILIIILLILIGLNGIVSRNVKFTFSILIIITISTFLGMAKYDLSDLNLGVLLQIITFSLLLIVNFSKIKISSLTIFTFYTVNSINVILGFLVMTNNLWAKTFLLKHYAAYYAQLLPNMLRDHKPVLYFGSHSIAGFFLYIFFYLNFLLYKKTSSKLALIFFILNLILLLNIKSFTALFLLAVALVQVAYHFLKATKVTWFVIPIAGVLIYFQYQEYIVTLTSQIFLSSANGFAGRYSEVGVIQQNFDYLKNNILPIGVLNLDQVYYTDNGFILNMIYGSIFLIFAVYGGLLRFLFTHLKSKFTILWIFGLFFCFEWGFPILLYNRSLYLLPFMIVFMKYIENWKKN